jgi:hypothetical protein
MVCPMSVSDVATVTPSERSATRGKSTTGQNQENELRLRALVSIPAESFRHKLPGFCPRTASIAQEYVGRQCRNRPHSRVRHQQSCSRSMTSLLRDLLGQVLDFLFHLFVHRLQCAAPIRGMGAATAKRRSSLARRSSTDQDLVVIHSLRQWLRRVLYPRSHGHPLMTVQ